MGKAFEKESKKHLKFRKKQVDALKNLKPNTQELAIKNVIPADILNEEPKNKLNKIKGIKKTVDRQDLTYRASE